MSQEEDIVAQFGHATGGDWHSFYDYATVLLLSWEEDDLGVLREHPKLVKLFGASLNFEVQKFLIPNSNPAFKLQERLFQLVKEKGADPRSLVVVFYAGHADDVNDNSEQGYSHWRAHIKENSPTLRWWWLQPTLYHVSGDVLVIMDCCHAALRHRSEKPGKMEVLVACDARGRVPKPGRLSFTSVLVRTIEKRLQHHNEVSIKWLATALWSECSELEETPIYRDLSEQDSRSIVLKPLIPKGFAQKGHGRESILFLRVSLADDPTGLQIASWLRNFPPTILRGVDVEALVLKARNIQDLGNVGHTAMFPGSILGRLSFPAQKEILQQIQSLSQAVQTTAASAEFATNHASQAPSTSLASQSHAARTALDSLGDGITAVQDVMETQLLFDDTVNLEKALYDTATKATDSQDTLSLKRHISPMVESFESLELPIGCIKFRNLESNPRFRFGLKNNVPVIVEFCYYDQNASVDRDTPTRAQLERMVKLLNIPKRKSFNILSCHGYIHEPHRKRFGVVFEKPEIQDSFGLPRPLQDLYSSHKLVSLDTRLRIAFTLAQSLGNFHKVGWVHKKFHSANILFFPLDLSNTVGEGLPDQNFGEPYLFGFECSRPEIADTRMETDFNIDLYRHPERWGNPLAKFEKAHDIYGLGVVLIEVARWKRISQSPFVKGRNTALDPLKLQQDLLGFACTELPYLVGCSYSHAVETCLNFKELSEDLNNLGAYKLYNSSILANLNPKSDPAVMHLSKSGAE